MTFATSILPLFIRNISFAVELVIWKLPLNFVNPVLSNVNLGLPPKAEPPSLNWTWVSDPPGVAPPATVKSNVVPSFFSNVNVLPATEAVFKDSPIEALANLPTYW